MLKGIGYPGAPQPSPEAVEALLSVMHKRAVDIGLPLDTPISRKGFWLGYSEGLVRYFIRLLQKCAVSLMLV
jgi:hypothetical protein